jgi:hypothetical protein
VRDLAILVGVSESGISHQLRLLRERRLVTPRREGKACRTTRIRARRRPKEHAIACRRISEGMSTCSIDMRGREAQNLPMPAMYTTMTMPTSTATITGMTTTMTS